MKIMTDFSKLHIDAATSVAIGKFDGVHLGHRALLAAVLAARKEGLKALAFTFSPSPAEFFGLSDAMKLSVEEEKRVLLDELGMDYLVQFPFTGRTASMEPETFIGEVLCRKCNAKLIAAGPDLSFGSKGRGDFALLDSLAGKWDYHTVCIDKIGLDGREISSTYIRELIEKGDMEKAEKCLGKPYFLFGRVVRGAQLGRSIGVPTMNLQPPADKLLPPFGVYYSSVEVQGKEYFGMTNVGRKPTVQQENAVTVETCLYDFSGDLYGKKAKVFLHKFRRAEKKFSGLGQLKECMEADLSAGRDYFGI